MQQVLAVVVALRSTGCSSMSGAQVRTGGSVHRNRSVHRNPLGVRIREVLLVRVTLSVVGRPCVVDLLGDGGGSLGLVMLLCSLLSGTYAYTNTDLHKIQLTSSRVFSKHRDMPGPCRFGVIDFGVWKTV